MGQSFFSWCSLLKNLIRITQINKNRGCFSFLVQVSIYIYIYIRILKNQIRISKKIKKYLILFLRIDKYLKRRMQIATIFKLSVNLDYKVRMSYLVIPKLQAVAHYSYCFSDIINIHLEAYRTFNTSNPIYSHNHILWEISFIARSWYMSKVLYDIK